jgi:uncharacterized protein DUF4397
MNPSNVFASRRTVLAAAMCAALLAACGGNDGLDDRTGTADPKVRLVHAIPGAPNVTLFRDGTNQVAEATSVAYKGASVYVDISVNHHTFDVRTATTPAVTVGSAQFDAHRGNKYTLIAVPDAGSVTTVMWIDDPFDVGLTSDNARVRAFNAAFNTPSVDVYLTALNVDFRNVGPTLPGVNYKTAVPGSSINSSEIEGGAYTLRLTVPNTKTVLFTAPVTLDKNADWLIVPVPNGVTAGDMHVLIVKADGGPAQELANQP